MEGPESLSCPSTGPAQPVEGVNNAENKSEFAFQVMPFITMLINVITLISNPILSFADNGEKQYQKFGLAIPVNKQKNNLNKNLLMLFS